MAARDASICALRLAPPAVIHVDDRALRSCQGETVVVSPEGRALEGLGEEVVGELGLPEQQLHLPGDLERLVAPSAEGGLQLEGEPRVRPRVLGAVRAHRGAQHRATRLERRRIVGRHPGERGALDRGRPPHRLLGTAGHERDPSGDDRQRRVLQDRRRPERVDPALNRLQLTGGEGRQREAGPPAPGTGSRSCVASRCSMARPGAPLASYQSAARTCSASAASGSTRANSPSRNSRNRGWYRYHWRRRSSGMRKTFDSSRSRSRAARRWSPAAARRRAAPRSGRGSPCGAGRPAPRARSRRAIPGRGSRRRSGRPR